MINSRNFSSWIYTGTTSVSGLIVVLASAKWLSAIDAGSWFTMQSLAAFLLIIDVGTGYALIRQVSSASAPPGGGGKRVRIRPVTADLKKIAMLLGVNIIVALAFGALVTAYFLWVANAHHYSSKSILLGWSLYLVGIIFQLCGVPLRSYLEGIGDLVTERLVLSAGHMVTTVLVVAAFWSQQSLVAATGAYAAGSGIGALFLLAAAWSNASRGPTVAVMTRPVLSLSKESLGLAWVNAGAAATRSAYAPIVTALLGAAQLAPLYVAMRLANLASTTVGILITSERALMMRDFARGSPEDAFVRFGKLYRPYLLCAALAGFAVAVGAPILGLVTGEGSARVPPGVYALLGLGVVLDLATAAYAHVVNASGRNPFKWSVPLSGIFTITFLVVLVPKFHLWGAVLAPIIAGACTSYWYNFYSFRRLRAEQDRSGGIR